MSLKITDPNITLLMDTYGMPLKYYSGRLCSCVTENGGIPKIGCGCNLGFWYGASEDVYGIRTSIDYKYLNTPQGRIYDGGAKFTIPKFYNDVEQLAFKKLAHGDVVVVTGKSRRDTDILTRGTRDYLFAFDVKEILTVSQQNKIYVQGQDFSLTGRAINWLSGEGAEAPADGTTYAVEFICEQQYKVWDAGAKERGTDAEELPKAVLCVLRRFVEQENANPIDSLDFQEKIF